MSGKKSAPKYSSLDGLRTIACLGIILMHVAANSQYAITGFVYQRLIPSFTDFVFLFMVLSAFGMCCGYHRKVLTNQLDLTEFYKKRYLKILPFFACLILLDLLVSFSREGLFEAIADLSLTFGLFPNISLFFLLLFPFPSSLRFWCSVCKNQNSGAFSAMRAEVIPVSSCFLPVTAK